MMNVENKILVGGQALMALGSTRKSEDTDYLALIPESNEMFVFDHENNIDYLNANGHKLFAELYEKEKGNAIASAQTLFELKAFAFAQHCRNFKFQKADDAEYDMRFLVRNYHIRNFNTVKKYLDYAAISEIQKIIDSVK